MEVIRHAQPLERAFGALHFETNVGVGEDRLLKSCTSRMAAGVVLDASTCCVEVGTSLFFNAGKVAFSAGTVVVATKTVVLGPCQKLVLNFAHYLRCCKVAAAKRVCLC